MRYYLRLVLTASFLFLSQGVQASSINDDNGSVAQGAGVFQVSTTVSSVTSSAALDQLDTRTLIQKTRQPGNITGLNFLEQTVFLEWLSADPVTRHKLLRTCRYYRAFVMPILGETHFISPSLRKDLLISIIAGQTGDVALFFRDQRKTFQQCDISELKEAIASGYYDGTLSAKTEHGKLYRSIGPESIDDRGRHKVLDIFRKDLRLVPLNFSGAEGITWLDLSCNQLMALDLSQQTALVNLDLSYNQLCVPLDLTQQTALKQLCLDNNQLKALDLSQQTALTWLDLYNNQLKELDLSQQTALETLCLSKNQLTTLDLSQQTALTWLSLYDNQLEALDLTQQTGVTWLSVYNNQLRALDLSKQTALNSLDLDAPLLGDQNLLKTLRELNRGRDAGGRLNICTYSKNAGGKDVGTRVDLLD